MPYSLSPQLYCRSYAMAAISGLLGGYLPKEPDWESKAFVPILPLQLIVSNKNEEKGFSQTDN